GSEDPLRRIRDLGESPRHTPSGRPSLSKGVLMNGAKTQGRGTETLVPSTDTLRLAAVADLHCTKASRGKFRTLFHRMAEDSEVFLLGGDLTDNGLPEEARVLSQELKEVRGLQMIAVLGNHDYHSDKPREVQEILWDARVKFLDGDSVEFKGVGFAGVKGFMGGFDNRMLQAWGEQG